MELYNRTTEKQILETVFAFACLPHFRIPPFKDSGRSCGPKF